MFWLLLFTEHRLHFRCIEPFYYHNEVIDYLNSLAPGFKYETISLPLKLVYNTLLFSSFMYLILCLKACIVEWKQGNSIYIALWLASLSGIIVASLFVDIKNPSHGNVFWFSTTSFYILAILLAKWYSAYRKSIARIIIVSPILLSCLIGFGVFIRYPNYHTHQMSKSVLAEKVKSFDLAHKRRQYNIDINKDEIKNILVE